MKSIVLQATARILFPLLLLFSFFLLVRGHNEPGGGFVGGLVAASGFLLVALSSGVAEARRLLHAEPRDLVAAGLGVALLSGLPALFLGLPFQRAFWLETPLPVVGKLGTPVLFDVGVYLTVLGISLLAVFTLAEEDER